MKKVSTLLFAVMMMLSVVFIDNTVTPSGSSLSAMGQSGQVTTRRRNKGVIRRGYAGGKWVARRTWDGTKWVSKKVWVGSKYVGKKSWRTGRKVVSRTKKVVY